MILTKNHAELTIEVKAHLDADQLVKGQYWENDQGCFIACLTHSNNPVDAFERFGLPIVVLRIAENIFERLPYEEGRLFFAALPDAVGRDGKDLSRCHWAFLAAELRALPPQKGALRMLISDVIVGMDCLANGGVYTTARADKDSAYAIKNDVTVAYAARAARIATAYAATSAAISAYAVQAAYASYASNYAAYAANGVEAARIRQRDTLLRLISEAPLGIVA